MVSVQNDFVRMHVQEKGAMVTAEFLLDGRWVNPFWGPAFPDSEDAFLRSLQGDFFCVPFGAPQAPVLPVPVWQGPWKHLSGMGNWQHGPTSHMMWQVDRADREGISLSLSDCGVRGISRVTRNITAAGRVLHIKDTIHAETEMHIPVGIHPIFRLPSVGVTELYLPEFQECRTYPGCVDESSVFEPDAVCIPQAVPCRNGTTIRAIRLPLAADTEELLWLGAVSQGKVCLKNQDERYLAELRWDTKALPNCLLWYSNRGRKAPPWNGSNLCLGVEPVASAFDLGPDICCGDNPLARRGFATTAWLKAGENDFCHSIELRALKEGEKNEKDSVYR